MTIVAAGFLLGVAASLHCVAMCGPLMSLVLGGRRGRAAVIYHGARVTSYAVLGVMTGTLGYLAVLAGAGRVLSAIVGLALIWSAAVRLGVRVSWLPLPLSLGLGSSRYVTGVIARAARITRASPAAAGVLNGLLPCGPVYAALAAAAVLGDVRLSAGFMLAFGAGTLPAVVFAGEIAARLARAGGVRWRGLAPAALAIVGVLLAARGLLPSHHQQHHHQHDQQHHHDSHLTDASFPSLSKDVHHDDHRRNDRSRNRDDDAGDHSRLSAASH